MNFKKYWISISNSRKAFYISLLGTLLFFIYGVINIIISIINNPTGIYQCSMSIESKCSLLEYLFTSDYTIYFYIFIVLVFLVLLIITNLISLLAFLYNKENKKIFWFVLSLILVCLIALPFIINYLQLIL